MSNVAIELTADELALIESKRAEEQARRDEKAAREAVREEARQKALARENAAIARLVADLRKADTNNILFANDKTNDNSLNFLLNGRPEQIRIVEHKTYGSYYAQSKGFKYLLRGDFNNYASRHYVNAATVIKKIEEYQADAAERAKWANKAKSLAERATAEMTEKYPNAEVVFEKGYSYGKGINYKSAPDRITVKSTYGSIEYGFRLADDKSISFNVRKRVVATAIADAVDALILG